MDDMTIAFMLGCLVGCLLTITTSIGVSYIEGNTYVKQAQAEHFCDTHCTWCDHHPDCDMHPDKRPESPHA